jgi:hypothetical protein
MVSGCVGFLRTFALTFGPSLPETVPFVRKVSRIFQGPPASTAPARRAILQVSKKGTMPTSITLNDRLAERIAALAAEAGQPVHAFVEHMLQGLVDADIEIRDGIPVFRMPPDAPVLTNAAVDRLLHSDLHSWPACSR